MVYTNISEHDISRIAWNLFQIKGDPIRLNVVQYTILKSDKGQTSEPTTFSLR
jgi:hypothetical protein